VSARDELRAQLLIGGAIVAAVVLVGAYLLAGGSSYEPKQTQDPCQQREWRDPQGLQEIAQQFSLSALDGAACELGVSREELTRALATEESRQRFLEEYDIDAEDFAKAIRAGILRAIDDAEEAGALSSFIAGPLRATVEDIPLDEAIELINNAEDAFATFQNFLGPAAGVIEELLP
jgi:hypothetical protein